MKLKPGSGALMPNPTCIVCLYAIWPVNWLGLLNSSKACTVLK